MLTGTEVKSLRTGKATIAESYASVDRAGEVFLVNANIPEYLQANRFNHRAEAAAQAASKIAGDRQACAGHRTPGNDDRAAKNLLQRKGQGENRNRARPRKATAR